MSAAIEGYAMLSLQVAEVFVERGVAGCSVAPLARLG
jgi:hypothetical protein